MPLPQSGVQGGDAVHHPVPGQGVKDRAERQADPEQGRPRYVPGRQDWDPGRQRCGPVEPNVPTGLARLCLLYCGIVCTDEESSRRKVPHMLRLSQTACNIWAAALGCKCLVCCLLTQRVSSGRCCKRAGLATARAGSGKSSVMRILAGEDKCAPASRTVLLAALGGRLPIRSSPLLCRCAYSGRSVAARAPGSTMAKCSLRRVSESHTWRRCAPPPRLHMRAPHEHARQRGRLHPVRAAASLCGMLAAAAP